MSDDRRTDVTVHKSIERLQQIRERASDGAGWTETEAGSGESGAEAKQHADVFAATVPSPPDAAEMEKRAGIEELLAQPPGGEGQMTETGNYVRVGKWHLCARCGTVNAGDLRDHYCGDPNRESLFSIGDGIDDIRPEWAADLRARFDPRWGFALGSVQSDNASGRPRLPPLFPLHEPLLMPNTDHPNPSAPESEQADMAVTELLAQIARLDAAATGGPWRDDGEDRFADDGEVMRLIEDANRDLIAELPTGSFVFGADGPAAKANAAFIAEARTLLPEAATVIVGLRAALAKISEGRGRFSLDPLTHAGNVIEDMQTIANRALIGEYPTDD